jgi:DNA-binding transcriptional ArsR family regulator
VDRSTQDRLKARAAILKAIAHPTRLYIIEELSRKEMCVNDLTRRIGADVSTVSKHLALLKASGIVADEKRGVKVYYRLTTPCVLGFFGCIETMLESRTRQQLRLAGKRSTRRAGRS